MRLIYTMFHPPHQKNPVNKQTKNPRIYQFIKNKRPTGLDGHLSMIAHTKTWRGISYMQSIKFKSKLKKIKFVMMTTSLL